MAPTLSDMFCRVAARSPKKVAIVLRGGDSVRSWTYGELSGASLRVASWLRRHGIEKGDRIALALDNRPEWCVSYFGILQAGGTAVPLDPEAGPDETRSLLARSRSRILFSAAKSLSGTASPPARIEKAVVVSDEEAGEAGAIRLSDIIESGSAECAPAQTGPDDAASLIYTSGTTGAPKGVILTHGNFRANFESLSLLGYLMPTDVFLSILPLHHAFPFLVTLILPLLSGLKIVYPASLTLKSIASCLKEDRVSIFAVTPHLLRLLHGAAIDRLEALPAVRRVLVRLACGIPLGRGCARSLGSPFLRELRSSFGDEFRFFICGGARLDERIERDFFRWGLTVLEGYGLTETSPVVSLNPPEAPRMGSVGKVIPGVEVRIDRPDSSGVGEILIRGANVMKGYDGDEEATGSAIRDGWFRSGDLGRLDGDGYLFIEGRLKEVIVLSSGKKVSAEEVEGFYRKNVPAVKDVCVFADEKGEKVAGLIIPDLDYFRRSGASNLRDTLKWQLDFFSQRLAPHKRLRDFVVAHSIEKTRMGKVKRHEAFARYRTMRQQRMRERRLSAAEEPHGEGERVISVLKREAGVERVFADDRLEIDLGIDSLGRVSLMAALEKEFDLRIDEESFLRLLTVSELIDYMAGLSFHGGEGSAGEKEWGSILALPPAPRLRERIAIEQSAFSRILTCAVSLALCALFKVYFRMRVYGKEHLRGESFIICPNHASYLDGFALFCAVPLAVRLRLFFLGLRAYFDVPVVRSMIRALRVIPVDPSRSIVEALRASYYVLRNGKALCVFPEGARSVSGRVEQFKKGVSIISSESGAKVIPAYIEGSHRAWRAGARFPRPARVEIAFGPGLSFEEMTRMGLEAAGEGADSFEIAAAGLRQAVVKIKAKRNARRGVCGREASSGSTSAWGG